MAAEQHADVEYLPLAEVHPYEHNPRFNDGAVEGVKESIKAYGFLQPIVVDAAGTILADHTRYKAAQELGMEAVPCIRAESLTPDEARAYRLADNKVADASYWDNKTLFGELDGLDDLFTRFTFPDMFDVEEDETGELVPSKPAEPVDVKDADTTLVGLFSQACERAAPSSYMCLESRAPTGASSRRLSDTQPRGRRC